MIYIRDYSAPQVNEAEILRYAGADRNCEELHPLLLNCLDEIGDRLTYKVCYTQFDIAFADNTIDLGFTRVVSKDLAKNLSGCKSIIVFAATVGIEIDRLIARYSSRSPTRALMLQAIGNERVESLCNAFCEEIAREKELAQERVHPRFSAGYGDLPLELQRDIFAVLDCSRKIGVTLNQSLLMSPSKSVTAIIGISHK